MPPKQVFRSKSAIAAAALAAAFACAGVAHAAYVLDDQPIATLGSLDFNNYDLASGGSIAYRGDYIRATWDGDLVAHNIGTTGAASVKWQAHKVVAAQNWNSGRKIFTSSASGTGVPFRWSGTATPTAAQLAQLGDAANGPKVLDYLRGDASNEKTSANPAGVFRERYSKIGAVIRSRPRYFDHGSDTAGDARERVYVGANDGMLHAFDAATGSEVFAYIPSMLFSKLKDLSIPSPTTFKYYVDGSFDIGTLKKAGGTKVDVLVGALGAGGKGVYGLEIDPAPSSETAAAAMAKFEITDATSGFANLGNVHGVVKLVKLNSGSYAALVPNGVNSTTGVSSLFVINPFTGAKIAEISAGGGPDNGLSGVTAVDRDGNGTADVVYAGDLKGTLWKFDLSATTLPTAGTALFTPATGTARPITATPSVIRHPAGGVMVNFATGQVFDSADLSTTANEYIYGIRDSATATGSTLLEPSLSEKSVTFGTLTTRVRVSTSAAAAAAGTTPKGWRITLSGGERVLGGSTFTNSGRYVLTTSVPNAGTSQGSWLLQIDALTGERPSEPFFDLNSDGVINTTGDSDRVSHTESSATTMIAPSGRFLGSGVWSQPVLAQISSTVTLPYFNFNSNRLLQPTTTVTAPPAGERGVYGGHFDFDIYFNTCNALTGRYKDGCTSNTHKHEYDDTYDVTGVNMLNASETAFNLSNAIASGTTNFKILLANTKWSPAAKLKIGAVERYVWEWPVTSNGFVADGAGGNALVVNRNTIGSFVLSLPVNAFTNREWIAGSGDVRAGLIPTKTGCVRENTGGQGTSTGAWMNGALTIQVVSGNTPASAVEATVPSDAGGYRLKKDTTSQGNQLAQYTMFWHHPNGKCIADSGWTKTPPNDTVSDATPKTPAAGSGDPKGTFMTGTFGDAGNLGGGTTVKVMYNGEEVIVNYSYGDNGVTQTIYRPNGTTIVTVSESSVIVKGDVNSQKSLRTGRLGWQELVR